MNPLSRRNFIRASVLAGTMAIPTVALASEASDNPSSEYDFSFLEDMTINQLRELQKEIDALLGGNSASEGPSVELSEEIFGISQQAYNNLTEAFNLVSTYGSDIYNAWYEGIYNSEDLSVSYLANNTSLSASDIRDGMASSALGGPEAYKQASDEERAEARVGADDLLKLAGAIDDGYSIVVFGIVDAYKVNGTSDKVSSLLSDAKEALRTISDEYSDYEHYPALKDYYSAVNAYFDFCENPTGSFQQLADTINSYENEAREYQNDLDFVFGE